MTGEGAVSALAAPDSNIIRVNRLVQNTYARFDNTTIEPALMAAIKFFSTQDDGTHIFCGPPIFEKPALLSLLIFGYPVSPLRALYQNTLSRQLSRCPRCVRKYHIAVLKFSRVISDVYKLDSRVSLTLMGTIQEWNSGRILAGLRDIKIHEDSISLHTSQFEVLLLPLYECICAPQILENIHHLQLFKRIFSLLNPAPTNVIPFQDITPGIITFLFGSDPQLYKWASNFVANLPTDYCLFAKDFDDLLVQAMEDVVRKARTTDLNEDELKRFWYIFSTVIAVLDKSVFMERIPFGINSIFYYLLQCILSNPTKSLAVTLLAFRYTLDKLGLDFWTIKKVPSITKLLRGIIDNPCFSDPSIWVNDPPEIEFAQELTDMVGWVLPLIKSDPKSMFTCGNVIVAKLIKLYGEMEATVQEIILSELVDVFALTLAVKFNNELPFIENTDLQKRMEMRRLCSLFGLQIIDACVRFKDVPYICASSVATIYRSIVLDVMEGAPSKQRLSIQHMDQVPFPETPTLWTLISRNIPKDQDVVIQILRAITYVCFICRPKGRQEKTTAALPRPTSQNVLECTATTLITISRLDAEFVFSVLKTDQALLSIIMNMLSLKDVVHGYATEVLCHAYGVDDRRSSFKCMAKSNLKQFLNVIPLVIEKVLTVNIFAPCPRLIKILNDVIESLFGTLGYVTEAGLGNAKKEDLLLFWNSSWTFLKYAFKGITEWEPLFQTPLINNFRNGLLCYVQRLLDCLQDIEPLATEGGPGVLLKPVNGFLIEMSADLINQRSPWISPSHFDIIISVLKIMESFNMESTTLIMIFRNLRNRFKKVISSTQESTLQILFGENKVEPAKFIRMTQKATATELFGIELFHHTVLCMDYYNNTINPVFSKNSEKFPILHTAPPKTFATFDDYQLFYWKVLVRECWQRILESKSRDKQERFSLTIRKIAPSGNTACEIRATLEGADMHFAKADLVFLSCSPPPFDQAKVKVDSTLRLAVVCDVKAISIGILDLKLLLVPNEPVLKAFTVGTKLHGQKVINLANSEAEFFSLVSVPRYTFSSAILKATPTLSDKSVSNETAKMIKATYNLNIPQAKAMIYGRIQDGISLVQGYV